MIEKTKEEINDMKTMKVIDLYNKIAKGEEVPKKVKYNGEVYEYINMYKDGIRYVDPERDDEWRTLIFNVNKLNDTVEILEEEKKKPKKLDLYEDLQDILNSVDESVILNAIHKCLTCEKIKINEIIDYLEYLKSKGE